MAAQPRSQRLIGFNSSAAGFSPAFVCPANMVVIVKSLIVYNGAATAQNAAIVFENTDGSLSPSIGLSQIPPNTGAQFNGWFILNPGDSARVFLAAGTMSCWLSGAVLVGAPPLPIAGI